MSGRRGRPRKYPQGGGTTTEVIISDVVAEEKELVSRPLESPPKRGRGRPKTKDVGGKATVPAPPLCMVDDVSFLEYDFIANKPEGGGGVPHTTMMKVAKYFPPKRDNDDEVVECADCGRQSSYKHFRLHNLQCHVNTAATTKEKPDLVMDHKYFARKLNEFKKLTRMTTFACPRPGCKSSYMSTLGLAYHMNTCGRSKEELDSVLLQCEVCQVKLTLPNMQWHRKIHEEKPERENEPKKREPLNLGGKRRSALIARRSFKRLSAADTSADKTSDDDEDEDFDGGDDEDDDELPVDLNELQASSSTAAKAQRSTTYPRKRGDRGKPIIDLDSNDYTALALEFLERIDEKGSKAWEDPPRILEDPFLRLHLTDNPLQLPDNPEDYLPSHRTSIEFKYTSEDGSSSSGYHCLNWFEGETVPCQLNTSVSSDASIHHTGGPVLSMAWHPSGKLLAVSTGRSWNEEIDCQISQESKGCVQIYGRSSSNVLRLILVCGFEWGYATHIQWSTFCPDIMDSFDPSVDSCFDDIEIYCRIGYLAMSCEDGRVRIMSLGIQDLKRGQNFEYKDKYKIKVYKKRAEIVLEGHESVEGEGEGGNVIRFDWHQDNRFLATGYANGQVAVFDLGTKSPLLLQKGVEGVEGDVDGGGRVTVINPFWVFNGHRLGVKGVLFDPMDPRYLVTCGEDRLLKTWDVHTKMERESKRTGICLDMCWVRGWMHQMVSMENIVAYQSAMHNYVRVFQMGSAAGKPSSAEVFNVTSLDFYHGLTAQGTDEGKVSATYYDWFWRECDYDRNRKKKNLVVLSSVEVDKESYRKMTTNEDFVVKVKKLKKAVINSKLYQRLGLNEEDGGYGVSLEAKFGNLNVFEEELPNYEEEESVDGEDEKEMDKENEMKVFASLDGEGEGGVGGGDDDGGLDVILDDTISSTVIKQNDGLIPIYDVNIPVEVPRINISFLRRRPSTGVPLDGLESKQIEEYLRFHHFIRINKVSWSPNGDVIAVGYRNGLITLLPGTFESIFMN